MVLRRDRDLGGSSQTTVRHPVLTFIEGHRQEMEILQHEVGVGSVPIKAAAPRFRELIGQNPEWNYLFEHFNDSPKHLVRLLVGLYPDRFLSYSHLYRLTASINVGESQMERSVQLKPQRELFDVGDPRKKTEIVDIMADFEVESRFLGFMQNPGQAISDLEALAQQETNLTFRNAYRQTLDHFRDIARFSLPAFKDEFQPRPYQIEAILKGSHRGVGNRTSLGNFDEMGTGKTLEGLARAEYLQAGKVLIVAPAGVKGHWVSKIGDYYSQPQGTVVIETEKREERIAQAGSPDTRFVIVSYDQLVGRKKRKKREGELVDTSLVGKLQRTNFDGLIIDEAHYANNFREGVKRSRAIVDLVATRSLRHLILLTGTPVDKVKDMDLIAHLLDPENYPELSSFSDKMRSNPRLSHNELLSKMIRRTSAEVLELPPYEEQIVTVELGPAQRALYNFIYRDEESHPFKKLANLRKALLHPRLVKNYDIPYDADQVRLRLNQAYIHWKRRDGQRAQQFNPDFLVQNGYEDLYLSCHFNLKGGVSELVKDSGDLIKEAWGGEVVPAKFLKMKDVIKERLAKGEKVVIFTSQFTKGVTKDFDEADDPEVFQSLLSYLQDEFGEDVVLKLDGQDKTDATILLPNGEKVSEREVIRRSWQNDPEKKIILASCKSSSLGIDLTISDPNVTGVSIIFESLPYTYGGFKQPVARVLRHGQLSPVNTFILEAEDSVDPEHYTLIQEKKKLSDMLLDAVPLFEEEEKILEESPDQISKFLTKLIRSPRQNMSLIFGSMLGRSAQENQRMLLDDIVPGETNDEYLARWHDDIYERGYSKYNSEINKQLIAGLVDRGVVKGERIADWGSGPLTLARTLEMPVYSLDIGEAMLSEGVKKMKEKGIEMPEGYVKVGSLVEMPKDVFADNGIDIGVCALALDCTAPGEERVSAIKEMHRSLVPGGRLIVTIPSAELGSKEYFSFVEGFDSLGLKLDSSLSGFVKGKASDKTVFSSWVFVLEKTQPTEGEIDPNKFKFLFEKRQSTRSKKKEKSLVTAAAHRLKTSKAQVNNFILCEPSTKASSDAWLEKGELGELNSNSVMRYLLDLPDNELTKLGYVRGTRVKDGKQEVYLTR
jgi:SNF2 family DNA or RNA helicase/ubiquinone/menaquinone biosynthesis C-methylase UbiE